MAAAGEQKQQARLEGESRKRKRRGSRRKNHTLAVCNSSSVAETQSREQGEAKRTQAPAKPSTFLEKMKAKVAGGHFRMINEKLYTCAGSEALEYFSEDPVLFDMEQMSHWPEQPVNIFIKWLKDRDPSLVVADFGCGNACLAKSTENKVFSIDLVSNDPSVIACDMANTPLDSSSVDAAVFCLSLMGTNYHSYLREADRVLKPSGWLLIAEVKSRFDPNTGGANPDDFVKAVCSMGYTSVSKDFSNKMFILFYFKKKGKQCPGSKKIEWPELKPCIYKRR
ncbi:hypothetical protein V2J09_008638 [Rumex salicifolius]